MAGLGLCHDDLPESPFSRYRTGATRGKSGSDSGKQQIAQVIDKHDALSF
ncbi:hypothetical protein LHGZ1_2512 [Laribacter hongkongensis]|uniref:Uncharacterized protein n=1 Tax=Laribacter hongkongensis TaxID=168471 RepID=A0A248LMF3_9NEIS|nr:hypothetical protein LHGZ1_2512 [Laribacter hongkongensis]